MVTVLFYGGRHLGVNRNFENYRVTSRKPDANVAFYGAKNLLQSSVEKIHINLFWLQQFSFLLKIFAKRLDQTVKCFSFEILSSAKGAETSHNNRRNCA